jgi:hypothetical protein
MQSTLKHLQVENDRLKRRIKTIAKLLALNLVCPSGLKLHNAAKGTNCKRGCKQCWLEALLSISIG